LGSIADERPAKAISKEIPKAVYLFFEAKVEKEYEDWPEKYKRGRKWMGWAEAREALKGRKELLEALERSSMKRDT
jgi:diphosphoinositol-polyphosphate diphosphatase